MPEDGATRLTFISLNTRGVPVIGSRLARRYAAVGTALEAGDADVVCFQEVFTWWHLRLLTRRMRSFRHVSCRPSPTGPAGGLVTFSRLPVSGTVNRGFGIPSNVPGISPMVRFRAGLKGALITRLAGPRLGVVNTHLVASPDGDWSPSAQFYPLHRDQLAGLARVVRGVPVPAVVCGDFNIDRDSSLFSGFMADTGLADAFGGDCPATFRADYLSDGKTPHCIDFILTTHGAEAETATVVFRNKESLRGALDYVSDHVGLRASLSLARP
jgi:endonuclease/exonuclease/phosphatase family metal-dependent hydrolase